MEEQKKLKLDEIKARLQGKLDLDLEYPTLSECIDPDYEEYFNATEKGKQQEND